MAAIPVRFKRLAAAFDDAVARVRLGESSGSEHSVTESPINLSDLVESFMEREGKAQDYYDDRHINDQESDNNDEDGVGESYEKNYSETDDALKDIFCSNNEGKEIIRLEVENAWKSLDHGYSKGFKRQLMAQLREKGFDAGLCKSKWERNAKHPAGHYQYIDVYVNQTRYIVEPFLAGQFEIARPSTGYASLLGLFPPVFVGRPQELKKVVRVMCLAIKQSLKSTDLLMPPWRRNVYMQSKWFSSYRRTTGNVPVRKPTRPEVGSEIKQAVGFAASPGICYACRDDFARKSGLRIGQLTVAFDGE